MSDTIENNREVIAKLGIRIDTIKDTGLDFVESAEQIDLFNSRTYTRITLFESYRLYIHLLNIETEETIYFFDDILENNIDLDGFVMQAIRKM